MKFGITFSVVIGAASPSNPADILFFASKDFSSRKDTAKYLAKVRKDIHNVGFVRTDNFDYDRVINESVDNVFVSVFTFKHDFFDVTYTHKTFNVYRPCVFLNEDNEFEDLNK